MQNELPWTLVQVTQRRCNWRIVYTIMGQALCMVLSNAALLSQKRLVMPTFRPVPQVEVIPGFSIFALILYILYNHFDPQRWDYFLPSCYNLLRDCAPHELVALRAYSEAADIINLCRVEPAYSYQGDIFETI